MKVNEKLSILFLLEKAKKDKDNKCPITIRITIDGKRAEISLGKKLSANDWDQEKGCGVGTAREVFALNDSIDKAKVKLRKLYDLVEDREGQVSPQVLKAEYLGKKLETAPKVYDEFICHVGYFVAGNYTKETGKGKDISYLSFKASVKF